jgi:uncharacterized protein YyaL (SSP411 family)
MGDRRESDKHTNRLIGETSPYLLQHAHNPVDWYPWGDEALERARTEDKLILLSIGYSACHWCHVMERESFEDQAIAGLMNDSFVNVKVDREERPDLDEIYMAATVAMNRGQGGWPCSCRCRAPGTRTVRACASEQATLPRRYASTRAWDRRCRWVKRN